MDALPYKDDYFGLTYMICTMQHSKDVPKTLSEMERVTKKGGLMVIIDGDKDSPIGKHREEELKKGTWQTCGEANWLSSSDFPGWDSTHLAPHIICLTKRK